MTDKDRIHKLRVAIRVAASTFRKYEQLHLAKGDEGRKKAAENGEHAAYLEQVIAETSS